MTDNSDQDTKKEQDTGPQGTRVFRRENIEQLMAEQRQGQTSSSTGGTGAALVGSQGTFKNKRFNVPNGRSTLGRDNQNDIIVNDDSVSLVHARLIEKDGHFRVLNLLSTNGTWVNNKKVSDSPLRNGDKVCFGEAEFVFQQTNPPADARPGGLFGWLRRLFGG